ncbi:hypothetical protein OF83DRAFT_1083119 [Amylostereum chailletii]|nr:hypothetical protein OF83DRAFT_1083119 [Amylostereum chailletii]
MSRKPSTVPGVSTRMKNKVAHPGLPDAPRPRKAPADVKVDKLAKAKAVKAQAVARQGKLDHLARLEDRLAAEDEDEVLSSPRLKQPRSTGMAPSRKQSSNTGNPLPDAEDTFTDEDISDEDERGNSKAFSQRIEKPVASDDDVFMVEDGHKMTGADKAKSKASKGRVLQEVGGMVGEDENEDEDEDEAVAVMVHKTKKGRVVIDAARSAASLGSLPPKSTLKKRPAPEARDAATKSSAVPPPKRARPIGGLNSNWTPSPGTRAAEKDKPSSPSPEPDVFEEGSDGDQFQATLSPAAVKVNTPTPRPRAHAHTKRTPVRSPVPEPEPTYDDQREGESEGEGEDINVHQFLLCFHGQSSSLIDDQNTGDSGHIRQVYPPYSANSKASCIEVAKAASSTISTPVAATLGPKSRKPAGTPGKRARKPRWTTDSLDEAIRVSFNGDFMAKVREYAGTLPPWSAPSVGDVQVLFDVMYPDIKIVVAKGEAIYDLALQCLKEWRSMIGSEALSNTKAYLEVEDLDGDTEGRGSFESAATYVEWALSSADDKNTPMYWARWNKGAGKEGRFQFHLILKTLSAHLAVIPSNTDERPYGALILCLLVVERALKFSCTGTQAIPRSPQGFFSEENWGDKKVRTSEGKVKLHHKASKFEAAVSALSDDTWAKILAGAYKWLDDPSNDDEDDSVESDDDDDFIMLSDAPLSEEED